MFKVSEDNEIVLTRGDTLKLKVKIIDTNGTDEYVPAEKDKIKFALKKAANDEYVLLEKEISDGVLLINPKDTKRLSFGSYSYDISITFENGDVDTFIANSVFTLTEEIG